MLAAPRPQRVKAPSLATAGLRASVLKEFKEQSPCELGLMEAIADLHSRPGQLGGPTLPIPLSSSSSSPHTCLPLVSLSTHPTPLHMQSPFVSTWLGLCILGPLAVLCLIFPICTWSPVYLIPGSRMTMQDLITFQPEVVDALETHLGHYTLYSPPPPAGGAILSFILNVLKGKTSLGLLTRALMGT